MDDPTAAVSFAALSHEARLKLFRLLVRAGEPGLNIGELGRLLDLPPSTLAHHLGALAAAGLVRQERRGREVINRAAFDRMRALSRYIEAECCAGIAQAGRDAA